MKKQLILIKTDLQYFQGDEESRQKFINDLTSAIKAEIVSKDPFGIIIYDKSYIESISLVELDTQNVVV